VAALDAPVLVAPATRPVEVRLAPGLAWELTAMASGTRPGSPEWRVVETRQLKIRDIIVPENFTDLPRTPALRADELGPIVVEPTGKRYRLVSGTEDLARVSG
jgi:hypothetical protein